MSNVIERLHASFFFYILTGPERFSPVAQYLASPILVSVAIMFQGLKLWSTLGWIEEKVGEKGVSTWRRRSRPVIIPLIAMLASHLLGILLFTLLNRGIVIHSLSVSYISIILKA